MSLALWAFNWTWGAPTVPYNPGTSLPITDAANARGKNGPNNTYQMLRDDYWEAREATLRRDKPPAKTPLIPLDQQEPEEPRAPKAVGPERQALLDALKSASTPEEMRAISAKLRETS